MMAPQCPGPERCWTRAGGQPCRVHGCRVCGSIIRSGLEDWLTPLCHEHAPEGLIAGALALSQALERMLDQSDGVHQSGCAVLNLLGRAASDSELAARTLDDGRSLCSCGFFEARQDVRRRFGFPVDKHDTDRAPPPASSGGES